MPFDLASPEELQSTWKLLDQSGPAPKTPYDLHLAIEKGLSPGMLDTFRDGLRELSDKTWSEVLAISLSQFKRLRGAHKPLSTDVGSQLVLFAMLLSRAEDVFGGRGAALDWFRGEQMALGGRKPIEMLDTFIGAALVDRTLRQIDYGVYI